MKARTFLVTGATKGIIWDQPRMTSLATSSASLCALTYTCEVNDLIA